VEIMAGIIISTSLITSLTIGDVKLD